MSASFASASSQRLINSVPTITTYPFSVGFWASTNTVAVGTATMFGICDNATTNTYWLVRRSGAAVVSVSAATTTERTASVTGWLDVNSWIYVVARFISATNRRISVINNRGGISHGQSTTSSTPTGLDAIVLGATESSAPTSFFDGLIAELWYTKTDIQVDGAQLDNAVLWQLAFNGPFSVPRIAKDIIEYQSFFEDIAPERDSDDYYSGAGVPLQNWTNTNGVTIGPHSPLLYRGRPGLVPQIYTQRLPLFAPTVGGGGDQPAAGTSTGVAVVNGLTNATDKFVATILGKGIVNGTSAAQDKTAATILGKAIVNGTAVAAEKASATVVGVAIVSGTDKATDKTAGASVGVGVVNGTSKATAKALATSTGIAVVNGTDKATDKTAGTSVGVAIVNGVGTSAAKGTATVVGKAIVNGIDVATAKANSTVLGKAIVNGTNTATAKASSTVFGKAIVNGVGSTSSSGQATGTSTGLAIVNARTAALMKEMGQSIGVAVVNGVATSTGGGGGDGSFFINPLIASVGKLMTR